MQDNTAWTFRVRVASLIFMLFAGQIGCEESADDPTSARPHEVEGDGFEDTAPGEKIDDTSTDDVVDSDTERGKDTASDDYDGQCPGEQVCRDVTGSGNFGCLLEGEVPPGNPGDCDGDNPCPLHHSCYTYLDGSGTVCILDCFECRPGDPSVCEEGEFCDEGMCMPLPCTADSCATGEVCYDGTCIPDIGDGPGANPGISCDLPPLMCDPVLTDCGELIRFDPTEGRGYIDYPENGETADNQYRSFARRDLVMLVQYAAAKVDCLAKEWEFGNGAPIGLIDMSEENGEIPGTSINQPGHPPGTHVNGHDIDIAYYQVGVSDNRARSICNHYQGGQEAYHCTATPHLLDPWRQALFIGALFENPYLRVIGCDGKAGPMLSMAFGKICQQGWLPAQACGTNKLAYEVENQGYGWYLFHHHHIHVSFSGTPLAQSLSPRPLEQAGAQQGAAEMSLGGDQCLIPGCAGGLGVGVDFSRYPRPLPALRLEKR